MKNLKDLKDFKLVYSDDPELNKKCPKCKELMVECTCAQDFKVENKTVTAILRIEKNGRGGKIVTVLDKLPASESFLKDLCTKLKKKCGTGGTHLITDEGVGQIEIQGDKKEQIKKILEAENIKFKG